VAVLLGVAGQVIRRLPHVGEKGNRSVGRTVVRVELRRSQKSAWGQHSCHQVTDARVSYLGKDVVHLAAGAVVLSAQARIMEVGQEVVAKERIVRKDLQDDVEEAGLAWEEGEVKLRSVGGQSRDAGAAQPRRRPTNVAQPAKTCQAASSAGQRLS
jgi:hypothetical protein